MIVLVYNEQWILVWNELWGIIMRFRKFTFFLCVFQRKWYKYLFLPNTDVTSPKCISCFNHWFTVPLKLGIKVWMEHFATGINPEIKPHSFNSGGSCLNLEVTFLRHVLFEEMVPVRWKSWKDTFMLALVLRSKKKLKEGISPWAEARMNAPLNFSLWLLHRNDHSSFCSRESYTALPL